MWQEAFWGLEEASKSSLAKRASSEEEDDEEQQEGEQEKENETKSEKTQIAGFKAPCEDSETADACLVLYEIKQQS